MNSLTVRRWIRLEYATGFILCLFLYLYAGYPVTLFFLLLLVPDISMFGYLFNKKIGAFIYNLGHNLIIPFLLLIVTMTGGLSIAFVCIWLAHICMDRSLGFGLKYGHSFKETHMQKTF
ncbi:DUF4260 domain-containing protein [Virgibacillus soli]|uniref:DUF4260 domain-containing protein n=1 Tax=Paracerasibacillus soli TaxID=480284 RepID=A0ABU5CM84_9BACI|nr:DUF4260 domain-containing protein [Virgibacillus soli]MDY0407477.1 DUF4260 domain-containing protein [Virgibacillus soli]